MKTDENLKGGAGIAEIKYPADFFPEEGFKGIHDPIHARALILESGERIAVISLELPSLRPYTLIDDMKETVRECTGIDHRNIWICMTHNLAAPHVPDENRTEYKYRIHMEAVKKAIHSACETALLNMEPVRIGTGTGYSDINVNCDIETPEGWWQGINPAGISDKTLTVIKFEGVTGKTAAVIYHYAVKSSAMAAAVMEDGSRYVTSDVTGAASRIIETKLEAPAIFFMGAAADQEPKRRAAFDQINGKGDMIHVNLGSAGFDLVEELGEILAGDVVETAGKIVCSENAPVIHLEHTSFWLPGQQFYQGGKPYHPMKNYEYIPSEDQELKVELLLFGNTVLFGLQPEATAIVGMKLREMNPDFVPLMAAMVNGGKDYLSDESAFDRMTFGAIHSVFARGAAELFLMKSKELLDRLRLEYLEESNDSKEIK